MRKRSRMHGVLSSQMTSRKDRSRIRMATKHERKDGLSRAGQAGLPVQER
jgi:hypothetical protein